MKMNFTKWFRRNAVKSNAAAVYLRIVAQSRKPVFFQEFGVQDTIDGRFDLVLLHTFLVLRRLKQAGKQSEAFGQALFDAMFANMDDSLRQMGVGDLSVGKKIKKMSSAFYGRVDAYDAPLIAGDRSALADALERNLYRAETVERALSEGFAEYMLDVYADLSDQSYERFCLGLVDFDVVPKACPQSNSVKEEAS
jgi:cytochrome b pre-mRNA-processing protein 3